MSLFECSMTFADVWRATRSEIAALTDAMVESLLSAGVADLEISGDLESGTLCVSFRQMGPETDTLVALSMVVRALNRGRVSAPGWPDDAVIDGVIGSVDVRTARLVAA